MINRRRFVAAIPGAVAVAALAARKPALAAAPPPGQQTYFFFAMSDPLPGHDEAYAQWFAGPHLRDLRSAPGVLTVQHYVDAGVELRKAPTKTPGDLILATVRTDQPDAAKDAIARLADEGGAWPHPDIASVRTVTYRATQTLLDGAGGEAPDAKPGSSATYLVTAFVDAVAGQDAAFNAWYEDVHEPELLAHPGVVNGQRAILSEVQLGPADIHARYLMQMTVVTSDLPAVFRGMLVGGPPSPAMDRTTGFGYNFRAVAS